MNVTGVEVIRRNPGVAVGVLPGEKVQLTYGDTLRVNVSFDYRGLAMETILEGAIGKLHAFPTEWLEVLLKNGVEIDLPESLDFTPCERSVNIPITSDIDPGTDYDLSVSLLDYREAGHPTVPDVIDIVGIPPEYELVRDVLDPYAYVYEGDAETCVFEFKLLPEQLEVIPGIEPFTDWLINKLIEGSISGLEEQESRLLQIKLYRDITPALWTNYRCEVTATSSPLHWLIIVGIIVALLLVVTYGIIFPIHKLFFKPKPLSPEIKEPMSRETLISLIGDFEVKLIEEGEIPGPPTPPEELEEMSDEELRDYCDELAEKVVPPPIDAWPVLILLGGLGVLGVGAAAALAAAKPKE